MSSLEEEWNRIRNDVKAGLFRILHDQYLEKLNIRNMNIEMYTNVLISISNDRNSLTWINKKENEHNHPRCLSTTLT